jgi:hypothetical protein
LLLIYDWKVYKNYLKTHIFAALAISPYIYLIYSESSKVGKIKKSLSFSQYKDSVIENIQLYLEFLYTYNKTYLTLAILSLLFCLIIKKRKKILAIVVLPLVLFPLINISVLVYAINWTIWERYSIATNSLTLVMSVYLFQMISPKKLLVSFYLTTLCIVGTYDFYTSQTNTDKKFQYSIRTSKMYESISRLSTSNDDLAIFLNFNYLGRWRGDYWVAKEIYYDESMSNARLISTQIKTGSIPYIPPREFKTSKKRRVFLVQRDTWTFYKLSSISQIEAHDNTSTKGDYSIYSVSVSSVAEWKVFLELIVKKMPEFYRHSIYEALIYYAAAENNSEDFELYISEYSKLNPKAKHDKRYNENGFTIDLAARLKSNIDYFHQVWREIRNNTHALP